MEPYHVRIPGNLFHRHQKFPTLETVGSTEMTVSRKIGTWGSSTPARPQLQVANFKNFLFFMNATDFGFSLFRAPGLIRFAP
jgi:hypothetical protein